MDQQKLNEIKRKTEAVRWLLTLGTPVTKKTVMAINEYCIELVKEIESYQKPSV